MAVEVAAWNVRNGLGDAKRLDGILENINLLKPHAMVFPNAYREGETDSLDYVVERFARNGYAVAGGLYEDDDGRTDRYGILGIVHEAAQTDEPAELVSLGSRMAVRLSVGDPATGQIVDYFGVHLDDRGEIRRSEQARTLLQHIHNRGQQRPVVIAGDFNAMHAEDRRSQLLRAARPVARRLPSVDPRLNFKPPKVKRFGSLAGRVADMADGLTMRLLHDAGFRDADPEHRRTKGPFDLDHILLRGLVTVGGQQTHPKLRFSDHRPISARARL